MKIFTRRAVSTLATALLLAIYVYLALRPFRWESPQRIENGASLVDDGMLRLRAPGILRTAAEVEWLPEAIRESSLALKLRVRTASTRQWGPARILTISVNPDLRNLTIAQAADKLVIRLRTVATSVDGQPELRFPNVFDEPRWRSIELNVRSGSLTVAVDQHTILDTALPDAPLQNWDRSFPLALGNELSGDRPWLGDISQASIIAGTDEYDYLKRGTLEIPQQYWSGVKFYPYYSIAYLTRRRDWLLDAILNLLCFVPLGFLATAASLNPRRLLYAVSLCCVASLLVELAQVGFQPRSPSLTDWILNTSGAATGAVLAGRFLGRDREVDTNRRTGDRQSEEGNGGS